MSLLVTFTGVVTLGILSIGLIFNAIADVMPDITRTENIRRVRSGWLNGVKGLGVDYGCPAGKA